MQQITINFEKGRVEAYGSCREYIQSLVYDQGRPQKAIAADMDLSPSHLSRKLSQSPDDSMRFTLDDCERFIQVNKDIRPVLYFVEKYLVEAKDREALEKELEAIKQRLSAMK